MDSYLPRLRLEALYSGSLIEKRLVPYGEYTIHSIFHRAVNIKTNGGLISITDKGLGRAPISIVLSRSEDFLSMNLNSGERAVLEGKRLFLGGIIEIDMEKASPFKNIIGPGFKWSRKDISFENTKALKSSLDRYAPCGSLWRNRGEDSLLEKKIKLLGIYPEKVAGGLIGFGIGLTPSGDDLLSGFLSVVNTCLDFQQIKSKFTEEIIKGLKNTSYISSEFLRASAEGYYHEYVQGLLYSMVFSHPEEVIYSTKRLLSIGATSGCDIAAGIYTGLFS